MKKNVSLLMAMWKMGISQADLARDAEISSEARMSRIINSRVNPTESELERLSAVLGCNLTILEGLGEIKKCSTP